MSDETIALIALPPGEVGEQVAKTIRLWHKFGLIEDALLLPAEELTADKVNNFEIGATQISDTESFFPLFQFLGETSYARRDLVVPWYIGDLQPSLELASVGAMLAEKIRISVAKVQNSKGPNETFFSTLLAIPSYNEVKPIDLRSGQFYFAKYDLNAMASSEIKASPGASSIPVKQGWSSFMPFVSAQIVTAAGLWKGNPFPLSKIVGRFGSVLREGEGKVVVFRSMTSAVVARNLARKMVSEALLAAGNPEIDPFQGGGNRPRSLDDGSIGFMNPYFEPVIELIPSEESNISAVSEEDKDSYTSNLHERADASSKSSKRSSSRSEKSSTTDKEKIEASRNTVNIIDKSINDVAVKIMQGFEQTFNYERRPELKHRDFDRGAKEVLRIFWQFSIATFKSMPYYIRLWFDKKFAKVMDKLFGYVRQVKEKYFGLEEELLEKIDRISDLRSESRKLDNLVLASAVFEENSRLWKNLRSYAFSALDLRIDDKVGQENKVFPHFKYITTDPDARYRFEDELAALLEVTSEVDFDKSHEARAKLLEVLNSSSRAIAEIKTQIEELKKPVPLPVEEPEEPTVEEVVSEENLSEEDQTLGQVDAEIAQNDANEPVNEIVELPEIEFEEATGIDPKVTEDLDTPSEIEIPQFLEFTESKAEEIPALELAADARDKSNPLELDKTIEKETIQDDSLSRFLSFGDDEDKK
jgi:hypothetical protein